MKQTIVLGNIITMDERRPTAKAALVKDGVFARTVPLSFPLSFRYCWISIYMKARLKWIVKA